MLSRMTGTVSTAMVEQRTAALDISQATGSMRTHAEQTAKALKEQSRAMRDISAAAAGTARQIKTITQANRNHSQVVTSLLADLTEVRRITDRNTTGVKETRAGTADLLRNAQSLTSMVSAAKKSSH
jgi:methyl-accepting chemotaxis protein